MSHAVEICQTLTRQIVQTTRCPNFFNDKSLRRLLYREISNKSSPSKLKLPEAKLQILPKEMKDYCRERLHTKS